MSRDQNAGRSHNIKTDNSFFEMVVPFKYLGTILTNQNSIQEEIKNIFKSENTCRIFFFQFTIQKYKYADIQNYNFFFVMLIGRRTDQHSTTNCSRTESSDRSTQHH
jgi:hypothetical protein